MMDAVSYATHYDLPKVLTNKGLAKPADSKSRSLMALFCESLGRFWATIKRRCFSKTEAGPVADTTAVAALVLSSSKARFSALLQKLSDSIRDGCIPDSKLVKQLIAEAGTHELTAEQVQIILTIFPALAEQITPEDALALSLVLEHSFFQRHGRSIEKHTRSEALDPLSLLLKGEDAFTAFAACSKEEFDALSDAYLRLSPDLKTSRYFTPDILKMLIARKDSDPLPDGIPTELIQFAQEHARVLNVLYQMGDLNDLSRIPDFCRRYINAQDPLSSPETDRSFRESLGRAVTHYSAVHQREESRATLVTAFADITLKPFIEATQQTRSFFASHGLSPEKLAQYSFNRQKLLDKKREELLLYYSQIPDLRETTPTIPSSEEILAMDLKAREQASLEYPYSDPYAELEVSQIHPREVF